jgi:hypothetical protein
VAHNFSNAIRRASIHARAIGENEMTRQIIYYKTNFTGMSCACGTTSYFTLMFGQFAPCRHPLYELGEWKIRGSPVLVHFKEQYLQIVFEKV